MFLCLKRKALCLRDSVFKKNPIQTYYETNVSYIEFTFI